MSLRCMWNILMLTASLYSTLGGIVLLAAAIYSADVWLAWLAAGLFSLAAVAAFGVQMDEEEE